MDKKTVRAEMLKKRASLSVEEKTLIETHVLEILSKHPKIITATHVGLYYPIMNELDLRTIVLAFKDKYFYYPRMVDKKISYFLVSSERDLEKSSFGILEPKMSCMNKNDLDVYIIPCVATDGLYRIGYGKGYFDQFLADKTGYKIGIVHPFSKLELGLNEQHDVVLDEVI
ncbi:MAG TPA: 5-formyltetrahydrofolate cyclo-ligase [Acholeplasma sp.]|nr:5-formyltetrahydrofolate cyclo-ligase [Acholeplasma sp.]